MSATSFLQVCEVHTGIMSVCLVRPIQFTDDAVGTHYGLILDSIEPFMARKIRLLILR